MGNSPCHLEGGAPRGGEGQQHMRLPDQQLQASEGGRRQDCRGQYEPHNWRAARHDPVQGCHADRCGRGGEPLVDGPAGRYRAGFAEEGLSGVFPTGKPGCSPGLSVSVDYFNIKIKDAIGSINDATSKGQLSAPPLPSAGRLPFRESVRRPLCAELLAEVGDLLVGGVRGLSPFLRYADNPEATKAAL